MINLFNLAVAAAYISIGIFILKCFRSGNKVAKTVTEPAEKNVSYNDLEVIENLNEMKWKIERLNDMMLDCQTCDPEHLHKTVRIIIADNQHEYDFTATGTNFVSNCVEQMIKMEREKLNSSLRSEIRKIK